MNGEFEIAYFFSLMMTYNLCIIVLVDVPTLSGDDDESYIFLVCIGNLTKVKSNR